MVLYTCDRCSKIFKRKQIYIRHCDRKYQCDLPGSPAQNQCGGEDETLSIPKHSKAFQNIPKAFQNIPLAFQNIPKSPDPAPTSKTHICSYCNRSYSTGFNLNKHLKICKAKKDHVTFLENEYERLKMIESGEMISNMINNNTTTTTNSNNTTTTQNNMNSHNVTNITLNAYGKEDLSFLTEDKIRKLLMKTMTQEVIPRLIKQIHCDPNRPENMNVYKPNKKDEFLMLFDGDRWMMECMGKVIDEMIDKKAGILDQIVFDMSTSKKEDVKMERVQDDLEDDDKKKVMLKIIRTELYNNTGLVKGNKIKADDDV